MYWFSGILAYLYTISSRKFALKKLINLLRINDFWQNRLCLFYVSQKESQEFEIFTDKLYKDNF